MKFEEIIVTATLLAGFIWLIDIVFFKRKRRTAEPIIVEYARTFFPVLLIVLLLRSFLAEPFRIPSGSMKPILFEGDFILVNKFTYGFRLPITGTTLLALNKPKRGDVIVFRHDDRKDVIKRVIGVAGDHIAYENKRIFVNGKILDMVPKGNVIDVDVNGIPTKVEQRLETLTDQLSYDIYVNPKINRNYYPYQNVIVPENSYFVMGNYRDNSQDSRYWGFVRDEQIIGKAFAVWMSWDSINTDVRWSRIGMLIK